MSGKKGMKHYPVEKKLEAVRLYYEEGMVQSESTKRLEIRDSGRVKKWLSQYRKEGAAAFRKKSRGPGRRPKKENQDAYIARLEMENALLKKTIPSCTRKSSRSAISGHLSIPKRIRSESHVHILWCLANRILCLDTSFSQSRQRYRTYAMGAGNLYCISSNIWLSANHLMDPRTQTGCYQPQGCFAFDP